MIKRTAFYKWAFSLLLAPIAAFLFHSGVVHAETFAVNTSDDHSDGVCDINHCSLREAIMAANENSGPDQITFNLPDGIHRVYLQTDLPVITDNNTTLEGPGSLLFSRTRIILDGSLGEATNGLSFYSNNNLVKYLSLVGFSHIALVMNGDENQVEYNFIGVEPEGPVVSNGTGIWLSGDRNTLRGNTVSGNEYGIYVSHADTASIVQNKIGTDNLGLTSKGNNWGIYLNLCQNVRIGDNVEQGNLISGNDQSGLFVDRGSTNVIVKNNNIGTDISGTRAIPNRQGIYILSENGAIIGGEEEYDGNLIAGNTRQGIIIATDGLVYIQGNDIGKEGLPNEIGIYIRRSPRSYIGGTNAGNRISYNLSDGIRFFNGDRNIVIGNEILHNGGHGIHVEHSEGIDRIRISQNNIGENGGKGIHFDEPATNGGIQPPSMISMVPFLLIGNSCPNCRVEVFLSDLDPSESGEGYRYLQSDYAPSSGPFSIPLEGVMVCSVITTTATDENGNTSEFSDNWRFGSCAFPPLVTIPIILVSIITLGATGIYIWRRSLSFRTVAVAILGGISAITLLGVVFWLNIGNLPQGKSGTLPSNGYQAAPSCISWIDFQKIVPPNGSLFKISQTPDLAWAIVDDSTLPHDNRWVVEVINPEGLKTSRRLDTTSIHLSDFEIPTDLEGIYYWRVLAEWLNPQSGEWQLSCQDPFTFWFKLEKDFQVVTAQVTSLPQEESTAEPQITPQDSGDGEPIAQARVNLNCRLGPKEEYDLIDGLRRGETASILGRNGDSSWWYIQPQRAVINCWVLASGVDTSGDLSAIPILADPPLPVTLPTPTSTPTTFLAPQTGCYVYNPNLQKNICVDPCPPNAQPGGACTP